MVEGLVSCVIPSYKRCDTVTRAIDSVLAQTYKNIEICLVDDNVPGDEYSLRLQEALKKYEKDDRVRYIAQEKHINGAVARNVGIKAAKGEFIGFLDDDDEWLPEKIERQMKVLQENPSIDAVSVLWSIYENKKIVRRCTPYTAENLQFKVFLREVAIYTSTILIKKIAIDKFGGFDESLLRHQDLQFFVDALKNSKFDVLPEYLVKIHADSEINRPNVEKLIQAKKDFFISVADEFGKYSKLERKRIKNAHYYEIVFFAFKRKKIKHVLLYLFKAGLNIQSIRDLLKRYKER
jgi:glycosyltransferase involved in cell wall biosynthesis